METCLKEKCKCTGDLLNRTELKETEKESDGQSVAAVQHFLSLGKNVVFAVVEKVEGQSVRSKQMSNQAFCRRTPQIPDKGVPLNVL